MNQNAKEPKAKSTEPMDRLLLLRLALDGGEVRNTDFKPAMDKGHRDRLVKSGYLETPNKPPAEGGRKVMHLVVTEAGWGWLAQNLVGGLPDRANTVKPLTRLLELLKFDLDRRQTSLGEFIVAAVKPPSSPPPRPPLNQLIQEAYLSLSSGRENVRVRLADLRRKLADVPRSELDAALIDLANQGRLALYGLDDPLDIRPEDREAAIRTATGLERHIVYLGGGSS